jgi:hypothetical protein
MCLQAEWFVGGKNFQEEWQLSAPAPSVIRSKAADGVAPYLGEQRHSLSVARR